MGQFTIALPNNQQGDVRWGTIRRKALSLNLFRRNKLNDEAKRGYIIRISAATKDQREYRLLKTKEGKWTSEDIGGFQVTPDDENLRAIKRAIDEYENQHR
jgi:hypothetical protein